MSKPELFPVTKTPRRRSKRNMHTIDGGPSGPTSSAISALMECPACGHDGGWWGFDNLTEARRGVPCPNCNGEDA